MLWCRRIRVRKGLLEGIFLEHSEHLGKRRESCGNNNDGNGRGDGVLVVVVVVVVIVIITTIFAVLQEEVAMKVV